MFDSAKLAAGLRLIAEAFETQEAQTEIPQAVQTAPDPQANVVNMYGNPVPEAPQTASPTPPQQAVSQQSVPREVLVAKLQEVAQSFSNERVVELIKAVAPDGRFSSVPETAYGTLYEWAQTALRGGAA